MSDWQEYILEDVIDKFIDYRGKTPTKTAFGIPLVTAKIVKAGKILSPNEFIALEDYNQWMTRGLPEIDDVVLTTEAPLGEVALIKDKNVALAQRIITLRGKKEFVFNPFLKYYFQNDTGQHELQSRASGTTVFGIKASVLRAMPIEIPSVEEQKSIATVLSSLDDKIDLMHLQNKTLEAMAETVFRQWFVEAEAVNCPITDLVEFNPTRKLSKGSVAPYLEMAALSTITFNPDGWYEREFSSGTKFINGDTLLARITPCLENGKTAYVTFLEENQVAWGSTEYIVIRPHDNLHPFFGYVLARNQVFREYAEGCMAGSSGRQRVDINHLKKFDIGVASNDAIKQFNELAEVVAPKLHANMMQIKTLEKLRDSLLPKLMNGEVRVQL